MSFSEELSNYATVASAIVSGVALTFAVVQIISSNRMAQEANALQAWREYSMCCFENPHFSNDYLAKEWLNKADYTWAEILSPKVSGFQDTDIEKYTWFLCIMLAACEQVLVFTSSREDWEASICQVLSSHREALRVYWPQIEHVYNADLTIRVNKVLALKHTNY